MKQRFFKGPFVLSLLLLSLAANGSGFNQVSAEAISEVFVGDKIEVSPRTLTLEGESKQVNGIIFTPSGGSFQGKSFLAKEPGLYRVEWRAIFGEKEVVEKAEYRCLAKGEDFFDVSGDASKAYRSFAYDKDYKGVAFSFKSGSTITFNRTFDLSKFDKNTPFIDFVIEPNDFEVSDFTDCYVRLSDALDESNYVEYWMTDGGPSNLNRIYTEAKFSGGFYAGYGEESRDGVWHSDIHIGDRLGAAIFSSFCASKGEGNVNANSIKLYFDQEENCTYLSPAANGLEGPIRIMDFDDTDVFKSISWSGFSSNLVKVSITPSSFSTSSGNILVHSVGGYDLSEEILEDEEAPLITVDLSSYSSSNETPLARLGHSYRIFESKVSDNFDTSLEAKVNVKYLDGAGEGIDVPVQNGEFKVEKEGHYAIHYNAADQNGNVAKEVVIDVKTSSAIEDISFENLEESLSKEIYDSLFPIAPEKANTSGGSGKVSVSRTIVSPSGKTLSCKNDGSLLLEELGDYKISYFASDVAGNASTFVQTIHAKAPSKPKFISESPLPGALLLSSTYELSPLKGVEVNDGKIAFLTSKVSVDGKEASTLTPAEVGNKTIVYTLSGQSGTSTLTETKEVVDTEKGKREERYFHGGLTVEEEASSLRLTCGESDSSSTWLTKLATSDFSLRFTRVATQSSFSSLYVKLTDASDSSSTLTLVIDPKNGKISYPTLEGSKQIDFTVQSLQFGLGFKSSSRVLLDVNDSELDPLRYTDQKEKWNGFPSGAYLTIGFLGKTGRSSVKLNSINNQALGYDVYGTGISKDEAGEDSARPEIVLNSDLATEQEMGKDFLCPSFEVFDVLSDIASAEVRVTTPSGKKITGDKNGIAPFKIEEYGVYNVIYIASDACGNTARLTLAVFVFDEEAPSLTVDEMAKSEYATGEKIDLPSYRASDNSSSYKVDVILILPSFEQRLILHDVDGEKTVVHSDEKLYESGFYAGDNSFYAQHKGKHRLRFVCYDEAYNKTVVERVFFVK